jgi:hypothetical protein
MSTTPTIAIGIAANISLAGRSRKMIQATTPTRTTWVLPSTVDRPAPT